MKIAGLNKNDYINGEGVCVSLWVQGCPHHCKGCHNPETWNFNGGVETDSKELINEILSSLTKNNIQRNFSILGGEPLCKENILNITSIVDKVKEKYPHIKIFIWTGYELEELYKLYGERALKTTLLKNINALITGRYIESKRDITLKWRGSNNQKILYKEIDY